MADNVTLPATGQVVRTVEISGIDYQVVIFADGVTGALVRALDFGSGTALLVANTAASSCRGMAAEGADVPANPVFVGLQAVTTLLGTPQLNNKLGAFVGTGDRRQIVVPWCSPEDQLPTTPVTLTTTADVQLYAAQAASVRTALLGLLISNTSATDTEVLVKDGTTVVARFAAPGAVRRSGAEPLPLPIRGTAATIMNVALSVEATSVHVTPFAFKTRI